LVDLKPMNEYEFVQGKKKIKLGGVFELDAPGIEYLLRINVLPNNRIVLQIAAPRSAREYAVFVLQSLLFLFKK